MPKVTLSRVEIANAVGGIRSLLQCKDNNQQLNTALIRCKRFLKDEQELYEERMKQFQKDSQDNTIRYCKKDTQGKAITTSIDKKDSDGKTIDRMTLYNGLARGECPEYDEKMKELGNELRAFQKEVVEVEYYIVKESLLPKTGFGLETDAIYPLTDMAGKEMKDE